MTTVEQPDESEKDPTETPTGEGTQEQERSHLAVTRGQATTVIVILLLLFGVICYATFSAAGKTANWQYRIETIGYGNLGATMNTIGSQGWELVSASGASNGMGYYECIFKKPR
jgi:hypothetical protein